MKRLYTLSSIQFNKAQKLLLYYFDIVDYIKYRLPSIERISLPDYSLEEIDYNVKTVISVRVPFRELNFEEENELIEKVRRFITMVNDTNYDFIYDIDPVYKPCSCGRYLDSIDIWVKGGIDDKINWCLPRKKIKYGYQI